MPSDALGGKAEAFLPANDAVGVAGLSAEAARNAAAAGESSTFSSEMLFRLLVVVLGVRDLSCEVPCSCTCVGIEPVTLKLGVAEATPEETSRLSSSALAVGRAFIARTSFNFI